MNTKHTPAVGDMEAITKVHGDFTDCVNDMAMSMQDATYQIGRQRGLEDGKAQRDALLAALQKLAQHAGPHVTLNTLLAEAFEEAISAIKAAGGEACNAEYATEAKAGPVVNTKTVPIIRKLIELPLGSLFRYQGLTHVYVLLNYGDSGLIGDGMPEERPDSRPFQGLYSAAGTRAEFESLQVEFLPVSFGQEGGSA